MTRSRFDDLSVVELYDNPPLREYLARVQKRHDSIRLLGLPDLRDRPSVFIKSMFVSPLLSKRPISVDADPNDWLKGCESVYAPLDQHGRLVLLGDPGVGKTTLLDYLTWLLTFAGRPSPLIKRFGWVLPVPMVLRELELESVTTFDGLLQAFLRQPVGEPLQEGDYLRDRLAEGRALVMLDGIDELGGKEDVRFRLRDAVFDGVKRYPDCLWLLTSRIVGYDEVPFEGAGRPRHEQNNAARDLDTAKIRKRYIAPFDDGRIKVFAQKWYVVRDLDSAQAGRHDDLVAAIRKDAALRRLARVPNVLALMALIHRIDATLPQEKWLLYERIAEAYLVSIDRFRGLSDGTYDLPRKKMWLGRVGFEMQCRRARSGLVDWPVAKDLVLRWLGDEMERTKAPANAPTPEQFLSFVGRRSGLFVPIGEDVYTFRHLSFQEYFAAVFLATEVTGFSWAKNGCSSLGFKQADVARWARHSSLQETFCFLFEMLADKPEWHSELVKCVFGDKFSRLPELDPGAEDSLLGQETFNLGHLAARLVANPHSGLSPREREQAIDWCVRVQINYSDYWHRELLVMVSRGLSLFGVLMQDQNLRSAVMVSICSQWYSITENLGLKMLDLRGANVVDISQVAELSTVERLILTDTGVADVRCIAGLRELHWLELDGSAVTDIAPLAKMSRITILDLARTSVEDIAPLANLHGLRVLDLSETAVSAESIAALQDALPNCKIVKDEQA